MKRHVVTALGAAGAVLAGLVLFETVRYVGHVPPPRPAAPNPLTAFEAREARVLAGEPNFRATQTATSPDGDTITGVWAADGPSTFSWTFGLDETVHLLDGQVHVDYEGRRYVLNPGDTASFRTGTTAVWHVPHHARKVYVLHRPSRWVRWWRGWAGEPVAAPSGQGRTDAR